MTNAMDFETSMQDIRTITLERIAESDSGDMFAPRTILKQVRGEIVGNLSSSEALALLSTIDNLDELWIDERGVADENVGSTAKALLSAVVDNHLSRFSDDIDDDIFAVGVLPAADRLLRLAEKAGLKDTPWMRADDVADMRACYDRVVEGHGTVKDLACVVAVHALFSRLMGRPKDAALHSSLGVTFDEISAVVREVRVYADLCNGAGVRIEAKFDRLMERLDHASTTLPAL